MKACRILICQLRQLGDILLTTPCLRAIKEDNPHHHISFLTHPMGKPILKDLKEIDQLWTYEESLLNGLSTIRKLRQSKFDIVLDFMGNPRSALFTFLSNSPKRYAFSSKRNFAYTQTLAKSDDSIYIVNEKYRLLENAGFSFSKNLKLLYSENSRSNLLFEQLNQNNSFKNSKLKVLLSPTHRRKIRKWPHSYYIELAEKLYNERQASITWLWGPNEETEIETLIEKTKVPSYKAPMTTLEELPRFISHFDLFIGNSNGPSHFAVAVDTPSLQLHGPTFASAWCPMTQRHKALQAKDKKMESISLQQVWDALSSFEELTPNL